MSIEQKLCEVKMFQLQSMSNAITCINKRLAVENYGASCQALIFNLSNLRTTILMAKNKFKVAGCGKSLSVFPVDQYKLTA